jgi:hypothetical protein
LSDFSAIPDGWIWVVNGPLDFSIDLVGQTNFLDFNWCAGSFSCGSANAPGGSSQFQIRTNGETGEIMTLMSMKQVPVMASTPATLIMFISVISFLLFRARKQ